MSHNFFSSLKKFCDDCLAELGIKKKSKVNSFSTLAATNIVPVKNPHSLSPGKKDQEPETASSTFSWALYDSGKENDNISITSDSDNDTSLFEGGFFTPSRKHVYQARSLPNKLQINFPRKAFFIRSNTNPEKHLRKEFTLGTPRPD